MIVTWPLALVVTAVAAWSDLRTGHIPNWLTGFALFAAVVAHGLAGAVRDGATGATIAVAWSLAGALACVAPVLLLFVRGAMGGGDLKLFAAIGALVHPMRGLEVEVYAFAVAALVSVGQLVHRGVLGATIAGSVRGLARVLPGRRATVTGAAVSPHLLEWLRLGPSIFVGAALTWLLRP